MVLKDQKLPLLELISTDTFLVTIKPEKDMLTETDFQTDLVSLGDKNYCEPQ